MLREPLEDIEKRYEEIETMMMKPEVSTDVETMTKLAKERASLQETVTAYRRYKKLLSDIQDLKDMLKSDDKEMKEVAKEELTLHQQKVETLEDRLTEMLIPEDPNDDKNVLIEIRGAAGGDEGNIFAGDLYRMYVRYAEQKGWKVETMNAEPAGVGGYSHIEFMVSGEKVYAFLKYESGVHRVQRVPETESGGRIHTSTATVLSVPEADPIDFHLNMDDIRVDTFYSSGPGGQSVNTTKSAVRLTHEPTGTVVQCQDGKSQHENKASALKILRSRLFDQVLKERQEKEGEERRMKIGTGDRSEKIRTYNYPQNRVTDHRIHFSIQQLDRVIDGKLDPIVEALMAHDQNEKLKQAGL